MGVGRCDAAVGPRRSGRCPRRPVGCCRTHGQCSSGYPIAADAASPMPTYFTVDAFPRATIFLETKAINMNQFQLCVNLFTRRQMGLIKFASSHNTENLRFESTMLQLKVKIHKLFSLVSDGSIASIFRRIHLTAG